MFRILQILCFSVICLLVFISYKQQVTVKSLRSEINTLTYDMRVIGYAHDVLQAEWAYVNGPERLTELLNTPQGKTLALVPRTPDHYISYTDIPMRVPYDFNLPDNIAFDGQILFSFPGIKWQTGTRNVRSVDVSLINIKWRSFNAGQAYMP